METPQALVPPLPRAGTAKSVQRPRLRASSARSKNGCTACRQKHVKCDERRPICGRCYRGAHNCAYKDNVKPQPTTRSILPAPMHSDQIKLHRQVRPSIARLAGNDVTYFDMYRVEVVHDIAGIGCSEFWTQTIMKHSTTEGPIQHSILAIGALSIALEGLEITQKGLKHTVQLVESRENHLEAAFKYHARALSGFKKSLLEPGGALYPRTILLTTMMLVAFEVLLGNSSNAASLLTRCHEVLRLQVGALDAEIPTSIPEMANPEDVTTIADIWHMLPRLVLINSVIPFLPADACLKLLIGEVMTLDVPSRTDSREVVFSSWKELCLAKIQLNSEAQWAAIQKDSTAFPILAERLSALLDKAILWGELIDYYILRETNRHDLHRFRVMKIQQLAMLSLRRDDKKLPILECFRQILAVCNDIFTACPTSYATRFQMDAIISPILTCMLFGYSVRVRRAVLRMAKKYAFDKDDRLKAWWTGVIMALNSDSADGSQSWNIFGEEMKSYKAAIDNWFQGTGDLLKE